MATPPSRSPRLPLSPPPPSSERLQKYLARFGLGSRRQIEEWIRQGRITIDQEVATLGTQVKGGEAIAIDGKPVRLVPVRRRVLAYYKPVGEMTTHDDPEERPTVFDRLPSLNTGRWINVGRLDVNTQGLLLVTTDGELAHRLMHPSSEVEREYAVRVLGPVDAETLSRLQQGVLLEDGVASFESIRDAGGSGANHWYHVILKEGRHREVRRLWESQGVMVSRLTRVRYGPIWLRRGLKAGHYDELDREQINELLTAVGLEPEAEPVKTARKNSNKRTAFAPKPRLGGNRSAPPRRATLTLRPKRSGDKERGG